MNQCFYRYKGIETPNGMPRIVEDDLFFRVQDMLDRNSAAPGMGKAKDDYLLTTKLFCGHCGEPMTGYSGTGKSWVSLITTTAAMVSSSRDVIRKLLPKH